MQVPCATLHEVINYLVEKTEGVLIPLIMEEPYEKNICMCNYFMSPLLSCDVQLCGYYSIKHMYARTKNILNSVIFYSVYSV